MLDSVICYPGFITVVDICSSILDEITSMDDHLSEIKDNHYHFSCGCHVCCNDLELSENVFVRMSTLCIQVFEHFNIHTVIYL